MKLSAGTEPPPNYGHAAISEVEVELVEICEAIVIAEFDSETLKHKLVATTLARKKLYEELENVESQ